MAAVLLAVLRCCGRTTGQGLRLAFHIQQLLVVNHNCSV